MGKRAIIGVSALTFSILSFANCDDKCRERDAAIAISMENNVGARFDAVADSSGAVGSLTNGGTTVTCGSSKGVAVDNGPFGLGLRPGIDCDGDGKIDVRVGIFGNVIRRPGIR